MFSETLKNFASFHEKRCEGLETAFGLVVEEVLVRKDRGGSENVEHIMTQANAVENVLMEILRLVDGCREKNWVVRCLTAKKFKEDLPYREFFGRLICYFCGRKI